MERKRVILNSFSPPTFSLSSDSPNKISLAALDNVIVHRDT